MKKACILNHWKLLDKESPQIFKCLVQLEFDVILLTTFSVGKEGLAHVPFDLHVAPKAVTKRERILKKKNVANFPMMNFRKQ